MQNSASNKNNYLCIPIQSKTSDEKKSASSIHTHTYSHNDITVNSIFHIERVEEWLKVKIVFKCCLRTTSVDMNSSASCHYLNTSTESTNQPSQENEAQFCK